VASEERRGDFTTETPAKLLPGKLRQGGRRSEEEAGEFTTEFRQVADKSETGLQRLKSRLPFFSTRLKGRGGTLRGDPIARTCQGIKLSHGVAASKLEPSATSFGASESEDAGDSTLRRSGKWDAMRKFIMGKAWFLLVVWLLLAIPAGAQEDSPARKPAECLQAEHPCTAWQMPMPPPGSAATATAIEGEQDLNSQDQPGATGRSGGTLKPLPARLAAEDGGGETGVIPGQECEAALPGTCDPLAWLLSGDLPGGSPAEDNEPGPDQAGQSQEKQPGAAPGTAGDAKQPDVKPEDKTIVPSQQQPKRILGVMPNFRAVSAGALPPPPTPKQAFLMATQNTFDYSSFIFVAFTSADAEWTRAHPPLGQGMPGFGRYYWRGFVDKTDGNYLVQFVLPTVFHEDERYYARGKGGFWKRFVYSTSRVLITPDYQGHNTLNISDLLGRGMAAGISTAYYPNQTRTVGGILSKYGYSLMRDALTNAFREFWPDIATHVLHRHP